FVLVSIMIGRTAGSPLFPYTTLFRSAGDGAELPRQHGVLHRDGGDRQHGAKAGASEQQQRRDGVDRKRARRERERQERRGGERQDRKSTRLNSSHVKISYAVFCLKKK